MSARNLIDLPLEIILLIFALLDGRQIVRCRAVCVDFNQAVENSIALQYRIELAICGYADGHHTEDTPAISVTRLDQFRRHIDGWNKLEWVETRVTVPERGHHAFFRGVYLVLSDGVATCVQLPSYIRGLPLRTWTLHGINRHVVDLALDPRSDLFVLVALERDEHDIVNIVLHLRTLSNNTPHPGALNPAILVVSYPLGSWRTRFGCPIHIMQHLVGSVFNFDNAARLFIWDWTTGHRVVSIVLGGSLDRRMFAFIGTTSFIVPQPLELEMYRFSTSGPEVPPILTASFRLLEVPAYLARSLYCRVDTLYDLPSYDGNRQGILLGNSLIPHDPFHFHTTDDNHCLRLSRYWNDAAVGCLFIPLRTLHRCSMHENPFAVPYETWAHGLPFHYEPAAPRFGPNNSHSGRLLRLIKRSLNSSLPPHVLLFDFNQNRARRRCVTTENPRVSERPLLTEADVTMREGYLHVHDWRSSDNPITSRAVDFDVGAVDEYPLCDDESIIFKRYRHNQDYSDIELIIKTMGAPHS